MLVVQSDAAGLDFWVILFSLYRFGYLACFASDVEVFLQALPRDKETLLLKKLMETHEPPATMPTKAPGQSLTLLKIQESVGDFFTLSASGMPFG